MDGLGGLEGAHDQPLPQTQPRSVCVRVPLWPRGNELVGPLCVSTNRGCIQLFEGMKAYKDKKGQIRLFRPMHNMDRMVNSAVRLALPVMPFWVHRVGPCFVDLPLVLLDLQQGAGA